MSAVSILHAPLDEALSEKIAAALARAGHAPLRVSSDPTVGDLANDDADDGAAIVVWTEAAATLARLHDQARDAMARGALIPVAVGGARPPGGFEKLPPVDLSGWTGALDDPRWRFVLDEIQLTQQRARLENGAVWPEPAPVEAAPADVDELTGDLSLDDAPPENVRGNEPADAPSTDEKLLVTPRARAPRRRFKSRDVAIGATVGLVGMTLATAVLAPVVLPGDDKMATRAAPPAFPSAGSTERLEAGEIPDPSLETPSRLASVQPVQSSPEEAGARADIEEFPLSDALPGEADAADFAPIETASIVEEADGLASLGDDAARMADAESADAPDSGALEALVAELAAEDAAAEETDAEAGAPDPLAPIDPLPEDLKETAYLGNYFKECVACPDMAALPSGSFVMGAPSDEEGARPFEGPARVVTIDRRFAIGTREVTYDQWDACVADGACRAYSPPDNGWGRGKRPVVGVSHADAQSFTAWLSDKTGQNYRLPTEAEWEFAARAGARTPFAFGEDVTSGKANFDGNHPYRGEKSAFRGRTMPVASFHPNAFGLFDMHGNAWEWTSDCWTVDHTDAPLDAAARISGDCTRRVVKGGAWNSGAWRLRAAHRTGKAVNLRASDNGFRVARDLD